MEGTEECDDGNTDSDDGCSDTCLVEPGYTCTKDVLFEYSICTYSNTCGDGVRVSLVEECDDGNTISGDGCSSGCIIGPNYICQENDEYLSE